MHVLFLNREQHINRRHEKVLRISCSDYKLSFSKLLQKYTLFTIHHKNFQIFIHNDVLNAFTWL